MLTFSLVVADAALGPVQVEEVLGCVVTDVDNTSSFNRVRKPS